MMISSVEIFNSLSKNKIAFLALEVERGRSRWELYRIILGDLDKVTMPQAFWVDLSL